MLKFFTYLFLVKSFVMFILIQQIKSHNIDSGIIQESDFIHEIVLALVHPGIFGIFLLFFVVVGNLVKVVDKEENGKTV